MTAQRTWDGCRCHVCQQLDPSKTMTDEELSAWLKAHPLDPVTEEKIEGMVGRVKKKLRAKPGPEFNLP